MTTSVYVGIDVSKAHLDVAWSTRRARRYPNTVADQDSLIDALRQQPVALVVVEATGIYHCAIVEACHAADIPVSVIQPNRSRAFAQSINQRAKTDAIDAQVLALYAERIRPEPTQPVRPHVVALRALRDRRDQVVDDRVREEGRLESCRDRWMRTHILASIKRLRKQEADLDRRIAELIKANKTLAAQDAVLQQQTGVATQTSATLLAYLPELGHCNRAQIAALAGLAPYDRSSGNCNGKRSIYGGRARVRRALYMASLSACHRDPVLKRVYQRLRQAGKPAKVALVAIARKLLVRLNSLMAQHFAELKPA